jgi:predicted Zn-dependent peptidase
MDFQLHKFQLTNSLKVLFQPLANATSCSIGLWVDIGSRYETDSERGYTHFLEHMLFKGTEKRTSKQQAEEIERVGGYFNAVTSREYTNFYITAAKDDLKLGLDILSDMVFHPLLRAEDIKSESKVILEELKSYQDSPDEYVYDEYFRNIFTNHSLGMDIIGNKKSIQDVTEKSIREYYQKHYTPDRMILSIAGDFNKEEIFALAENYFSNANGKSLFQPESSKIVKTFDTFFINRKLEQVNFLLGAEGFPRDFKTAVRLGIITGVFGGGMSSRLFQNIREKKGLCYSISAFPSSYFETGIVNISCATSTKTFSESVASIIEEVKILQKDGITQDELDFSKSSQKGSLSIGYEIPEGRMTDIASQELYFGKFYSYKDRLAELYSVQLDEINAMIEKIFSIDKMHLTGIGKISDKEIKALDTSL